MTSDISQNTHIAIPADVLRHAVSRVLLAEGASNSDAQEQATLLLEGELRGHPSHGVRRLAVLVDRLRHGLIKSPANPGITWVTDSFVRVDGGCGFGPVVAKAAVSQILERSLRTGIAIATVSNSNHVGMLAPYVEEIAKNNQVGIALTSSEALVHPWGSAKPMIGTNPIAVAVPTNDSPLVLDMATAAVSMGKILDHAERSERIPLGWAVDRNGEPSVNPSEVLEGALSPFGGSKGYALGITLEVLLGVISMTAFGTDKAGTLDAVNRANKGDVFIAICLEKVGALSHLPLASDYLNRVRSSGFVGGEVFIPGDRARALREARISNGVPINRSIWEDIIKMLKEID